MPLGKQLKNVLLVTNATAEAEIVLIQKALDTAREQGLQIQLNLVHVVPNLLTCYFNIPSMAVLSERYYDEATKALISAGELLGVAKKNQWLITGKIRIEVMRLAQKLNADYILANGETIKEIRKSSFLFAKSKAFASIQPIDNMVEITE